MMTKLKLDDLKKRYSEAVRAEAAKGPDDGSRPTFKAAAILGDAELMDLAGIPGVRGIIFVPPFAKVFGCVEYKFFAGSFAMFEIRVGHLALLVAYGSPLG